MTEPENSAGTEEKVARTGDPLDGLWHWTQHPAARIAAIVLCFVIAFILFPVMAQFTF